MGGMGKSEWPAGPWSNEPDRVEWRHAGLPCLLVRSRFGAWCGYAGVFPGHPWHGQRYDADQVEVSVHGGLTYSAHCQGDICHVPAPGEPDDVYWFGLDCGHVWDLVPGLKQTALTIAWPESLPREVYRDVEYARGQVERLAEQFAAVSC